jgi:peptidoglycan hydrolase-like protein with peptidoglycan-binding domain
MPGFYQCRLLSMKVKLILSVVAIFALAGVAGAAAKKKKAVHRTATANHPATTSKRPAAANLKSGTSRKKGRTRSAAITRRGARQLAPTADRYKEIQKALADRGYLKAEPNGVWDSNSQEAMRAFQSDQKLDPSGKITAASLIDLGLGPKREETLSSRPTPPGGPVNAGQTPGAERDASSLEHASPAEQ